MSTLSGQGILNELKQQVNSVTENLTTADQQLNSQWPAPYVEVEAGSVAHGEYSSYNGELKFSDMSPNTDGNLQQIFKDPFYDDLNPELGFRLDPASMAQTEDMNPHWESFPTTVWSLGEGEGNPNTNELPRQFNSHDNSLRDVEEGVRCLGPNPSHLDHADQASNGRIQKAPKPRLTPAKKRKSQLDQAGTSEKREAPEPVTKRMKKREADKKHREKKKMELNDLKSKKSQYDKLMERVSRFGGIDNMESQINHSNGELHRLEEMKSKYGGIQEMESTLDKFKEMEAESHRLKLLKSKYGEIEELESMLDKFKEMKAESHKLDQVKSKLGGIQETESIVDKFKEMEAELHSFDQIKLSFGGIEEIESGLNRLKKTELELEKYKQMVNQNELESFPPSPGSRQQMEIDECYRQQLEETDFHRFEQMKSMLNKFHEMETEIKRLKRIELQLHDNHNQKELPFFQLSPGSLQEHSGSQSYDLNGDSHMVSDHCGISLNSFAAVSGTTPDMQYSDVLVDQLVASLTDENVVGNLDLNSFKDLLEGEPESVGKYKIPPSLVSTARDILKVHGDITETSKYSVQIVQTIFVLFCAAIKEMGDLSLEEVTEKIILKLRDPIMDAKRSEFDVEFALKHLKTIVQGYFGLKARKDLDRLKQRMASLRADEEALRKELEKKSNEIKTEEAKQGDLTSKQCKICLESADKFLGKMVGIF